MGSGTSELPSLYELFRQSRAAHGDDVALRYKKDGQWADVSWAALGDTADQLTRGLLALGMKKGDRVAILSQSRLEWVLADTAIIAGGGVSVGIYPSNLGSECAYILEHSDTEILFVENREQLEKIDPVRGELPRLRKTIVIDGPGDEARGVLGWYDLMTLGEQVEEARLAERGAEIRQDDLAALVYTSGTTGTPKAVMITHGNLLFASWSAAECNPTERGWVTLLFLPLAHVFARLIVCLCLRQGVIVAFAESIAEVPQNLKEIRPQFIASVPRIFEKVHEKITTGVEQAGGAKKKVFDWALSVGRQVSLRRQSGQAVSGWLGLKYRLATKLVFAKIQAALGGRMVYAISGAAPLNKTIAEFFHACGILILEGIGMTENTSFSNVNRVDQNKFGTVGQVGPGIEMKLGADGEVLYRGPNLMLGYFKNPDATAETIDQDGWLHTGDIGEIDGDGFLKITDRKKDLIITAGGKNIAPQRIERTLRTSRYISQVVAYGDKRKYISALISLDPENITEWAKRNGLGDAGAEELARHPRVSELIEREIKERNSTLASFESVKRFRILPRDLSVEGGELTPTLKIKRKVVCDKFADLLDSMYDD
jgi:long-chain acyl-CoA synthetase